MIITDQVTKLLVKGIKIPWLGIDWAGMSYGSQKTVLGKFFKLTFIENPGMAFGLNVGPKVFLTLFTIAASLLILYYIWKHRSDGLVLRLALALILAGAVGNLIDRTFYGKIYGYAPFFEGRVVDFFQVDFWDFTIFGKTYTTWPIFNVADIAVTVGFLMILFFHKKIFKEKEPQLTTPDGDAINPDEVITSNGIQTENLNDTSLTIEDTKKNADSDSSGTEEAKN